MSNIVVVDIPVIENEIQVVDFNNIATKLNKAEIRSFIKDMETKMMSDGEHIEIPVNHHFSKDVYAREMVVPKGTLLVGKIHKHQNLNILSQGEVSILSIDGSLRVKAPYTFVGSPGSKRLFYMHEDTVWTTIHGTNETDIDKIEDMFIAKNYEDVYLASKKTFNDVISILGFSEQELTDISENEADMVYIGSSADKFEIKESEVHNKGIFAKVEIKKGELIGPARLNNMRTEIGKYSNHSSEPNAKMVKNDIGDIDLIAVEDIKINTEITTDYFYNYTVSRENLCLG